MFLCFGSQKPESSDHSRQNYNYMVTSWNCCLHYNSGNRFPDFPIGLNWGQDLSELAAALPPGNVQVRKRERPSSCMCGRQSSILR